MMSMSQFIARRQLNDLPADLGRDNIMIGLVSSALDARRTVRIQYSRSCDTYSVSLVQGDRVISALAYVSVGEFSEALAETSAAAAARLYGLDITRLDIP
jgi:hypothetical protein